MTVSFSAMQEGDAPRLLAPRHRAKPHEPMRIVVLGEQLRRFAAQIRQAAQEASGRFTVLEWYKDISSLLQRLPRLSQIDLFLVDLGDTNRFLTRDPADPISGLTALDLLGKAYPQVPRMVISPICEPETVGGALTLDTLVYIRLEEALESATNFGTLIHQAIMGMRSLSIDATVAAERWGRNLPSTEYLMVPLREGIELWASEADALAREMKARRTDESKSSKLRQIVQQSLQRNADSWRPRLPVNTHELRAFSSAFTADDELSLMVTTARLPIQTSPTPRQREVLEFIQAGFTYQAIADFDNVTIETVNTHIQAARNRIVIEDTGERWPALRTARYVAGRDGLVIGTPRIVSYPLPRQSAT